MLPETVAAPIDTELPEHIVLALPTVAEGSGFTVTFTESELEQPVAVIVSVSLYIVVTVGLTDGFALEEVNPLGLLVQLKVRPPGEVAPILADVPLHTVEGDPTDAVGRVFTVIFTESDLLQPVAVIVSVSL